MKTSGGSGSEASKWRRFGHAQSGEPGSEASKWRRFGHAQSSGSWQGLLCCKCTHSIHD